MVCLLLSAAGALAAGHWTVNPHAFQYDMTVYAALHIGNQALTNYADYEVAAFCEDECRGVAKVQTATDGTQYLYLRVYSNAAADETLSFRVFQRSTGKESFLPESIGFEAETMAGTPGEPIVLTLNIALKGDANGDGTVDIADVTAIINYINGNVSSNFNEVNADVNSDGKIDIADVTGIINIINSK